MAYVMKRGELYEHVFRSLTPELQDLLFRGGWTDSEWAGFDPIVSSAFYNSESILQIYNALLDADIGVDSGHQNFVAMEFINRAIPNLCNVDSCWSVISQLLENVDVFPGLPVMEIQGIGRAQYDIRCGSLIRDEQNRLLQHSDLLKFTSCREQALSFYMSAVWKDDVEAINHLNKMPEMREHVRIEDIQEIFEKIDRYTHYVPSSFHGYFSKLKTPINVRNKFCEVTPILTYANNVDEAVRSGSMKSLDDVFDPALSIRAGYSLISDVAKLCNLDSRARAQLNINKVAASCVVKLIESGVPIYPAYLELRYGRYGVIDLIDTPPNRKEIIDRYLDEPKPGSPDMTFVLLMFTVDELLEHERGQDLLERLHGYTNDAKLLKHITSLEYRGKAFSSDLEI